MGRDYFLDKDLVLDRDNNIYYVYSNINPFGYIYAILKYVFTGKGLWKGYERALKYYGIHNVLKVKQEFIHECCYGVSFPVLRKSAISNHLKPEEKIREIIKHPSQSKQELTLLEIIQYIHTSRLGVSGSLLTNTYHELSDLDIVIYGCKESLNVIESFEGFNDDEEWIYETSKNYGLELDLVKKLYTRKIRGKYYNNVKYSILFVDDKPQRYCEDVCIPTHKRVKIKAEIEPDCKALFYPSKVSLYHVEGDEKVDNLVSYEGIYSYLLYSSRKIEVDGLLVKCENSSQVIVGDRNVGGRVRRIL
ncbi:nucleotidyltransferase [Sulfolobus acidocaldarius]|uniref:Conserved Archaeal protein n=4 Tax=Sulfolobus acidocaldarius TaxID=2285 RepID=Q4JBF7_SULAC|nr:nucleotidyltransferase [Sulfolobus acidocaldarius]AAY79872.1 conserved Archaeal protein [Sulfolobus acidocaldarius DSM 639]AGE70434.1 DNA polymerase beta domain protein region [Sulfolobus acidocaldarius N8]AGE72708.1 DNA polymerase beta domain protein region [Sulfolobus acidocaldarius Ron12/I]ALU29181.1 DNA polymerase [Sulfolobus acidocaldarius]ALU31908.1 DNA polymerase [Sulfolobus acidocaldarius]